MVLSSLFAFGFGAVGSTAGAASAACTSSSAIVASTFWAAASLLLAEATTSVQPDGVKLYKIDRDIISLLVARSSLPSKWCGSYINSPSGEKQMRL